MRLTKLKLSGFKTFVDPTSIDFPSNLVGVVGPNGCGKSNVIDAVRWVLGETRASALRGESMQDVIFNGSNTRKPVARASVELVFENDDGKATGQWGAYAEISVKRVLDRTGDSSYYINQTHVRRKDVIDLFLGTGLGPRAYAIIEQGMISRIIEAKPEEIRAFMEEAAGVTKYRERRKETEGRLSDANENLLRLEDIRAELGERVTRLEAQAQVATHFKNLQNSHREKQQLLWLLKRNEAHSEFNRIQNELAALSQKIDDDNARIAELESAIETARHAHLTASDAVQYAQSDFFSASAELSRLEAERKHNTDTQTRLETQLNQLTGEAQTWQQRQNQLESDAERWLSLLENAQRRLEQTQARHETLAEQLPDLDAAYQQAETTLQSIQRELTQSEQQRRVEETKRMSAQRALDALVQRKTRLEEAHTQIAGPSELELAQATAKEEAIQDALEEAQAQLLEQQTQLPLAQQALKDALQAERQSARALTELRAQRDALSQLQAKVTSQGELGAWLKQHQLDQLESLWQGVRVAPGWERAFEAILRERLTALVNETNAAQTLLNSPPPNSLSVIFPQTGPSIAAQSFDNLPPLLAHIEILNPALTGALHAWLGHVWTAAHLLDWLPKRESLPPGVCLIDPEGTLLTAQCISHYAPDARTHGIIERQREIDALNARQDALENAQAQAKASVSSAEEKAQTLSDAVNSLRQNVQALQGQTHNAQLETLKLTQAHQRAQERQAQFAQDIADIQQAERTEQSHLMQAELEYARIEELTLLQRTRQEAASEVLNERANTLRETRTLEQALLREVQEAQFSERECTNKQNEITQNRALAQAELTRIHSATLTAETELTTLASGFNEAALQAALDLRASREQALIAQRDALAQAAQHLKTTEENKLRLEHEIAPLRSKVADLRLGAQASELAIAQFEERLKEVDANETELALLLSPALKESHLQREVARLAKEMSELGAVNLAAVDELAQASERKNYLDEQHTDLSQAISTLEDAIRRIDRETREQLQQTYNIVTGHFSTLFPQLFGGGQAKLVLTGDEILDAGIQIVAQPPGKKNSSIHLLSGGEKALTAIALVFSMFQLNPAPFCMLDEVDAPLDDTNTERYGKMVKRMSAQTQFIFISHSKITMEIAQQLIGVTMQEQGVSRVVAVDMDEALKLTTSTPA